MGVHLGQFSIGSVMVQDWVWGSTAKVGQGNGGKEALNYFSKSAVVAD